MKALIVVDMQFDFLPGGALAVPDGDAVIPVIERLMQNRDYWTTVATRDWHPPDSKHFEKWPVHCVQDTWGARLIPLLIGGGTRIISKGMGVDEDGYSGFEGEPDLEKILKNYSVEEVDVVGLALDHCVKATALDARERGFKTRVLLAGTRAVSASAGRLAVDLMRSRGVQVR